MQNYNNTTGAQTHSKSIQASDIKSLIQKQGRATIGDKVFTLTQPASTDPKLQAIINDPAVTVKPVNGATSNGQCEYELSANGKSVKITVETKTFK